MSAGDTNIAAAEAGPPPLPAKTPVWRRPRRIGAWLVLPAVLAVLAVSLFPIAQTLILALEPSPHGFQALSADPRFWAAARRTLLLAGLALPLELLLGLALAGVFFGRMPGKAIFVSLLALPALVAPVVAGGAWRILFNNDYGPVNHILGGFAGGAVMTLWTQDPDFALLAVLIADVWQWTPFMFVLMAAALGNVDRGQLDAAAIADAGPWRTLSRVVLPAIWPAIAIAVAIRALDLLRLFDIVWTLTGGGPETRSETLATLAYGRLSEGDPTGAGAAMAFAFLAAVPFATMLALAGLGRKP